MLHEVYIEQYWDQWKHSGIAASQPTGRIHTYILVTYKSINTSGRLVRLRQLVNCIFFFRACLLPIRAWDLKKYSFGRINHFICMCFFLVVMTRLFKFGLSVKPPLKQSIIRWYNNERSNDYVESFSNYDKTHVLWKKIENIFLFVTQFVSNHPNVEISIKVDQWHLFQVLKYWWIVGILRNFKNWTYSIIKRSFNNLDAVLLKSDSVWFKTIIRF